MFNYCVWIPFVKNTALDFLGEKDQRLGVGYVGSIQRSAQVDYYERLRNRYPGEKAYRITSRCELPLVALRFPCIQKSELFKIFDRGIEELEEKQKVIKE